MLKVYVLEKVPHVKPSILLQLMESQDEVVGGLFQKIPTEPFRNLVTFVSDPVESDYFMLPHNYFDIASNSDYVSGIENEATIHNKEIIVFAYGDKHDEIAIDHAIILRSAKYRSSLRSNEFIVPAFVEDLGAIYGIEPRAKSSVPTVGFAGWVKFSKLRDELKYKVRLLVSWWNIQRGKVSGASYQGLYYRRRAIAYLKNSKDNIKTLFSLRSSYSGNVNTISASPQSVRVEFVSSIKNSDLPLVVRGDGNYSLRFYEVLSLGRVPLFIDTETPLPLEDEIDYDSFMVRVHYNELDQIESRVMDFWRSVSNEEFIAMQTKARIIFETRLSPRSFYQNFFVQLAKEQ